MEEDVFNHLRNKLALGIMIVFGSILSVLIIAFNIYLDYSNKKGSELFISEVIVNEGIKLPDQNANSLNHSFKPDDKNKSKIGSFEKNHPIKVISKETDKPQKNLFETSGFRDFFSARLDYKGEITEIINDFTDSDKTYEYTQKIIHEIMNRKHKNGTFAVFGYSIAVRPYGYLVVLLDRAIEIEQQMNFAYISIAIFGITLLLSYFLAFIFAMEAVKPVEESYVKQKRFIADASHELKTPIAVIGANIDVLKNEIPDNKWIGYIETENTRMSALVKDLLYLAKNDAGREKLTLLPFDLVECMNVAALPFESVAFEQGKTLEINLPKEPVSILADETKIKQAIIILIDNALKNTDAGGLIKITLTAESKFNVIKVYNTGKGIPQEEISKIFDRFYRADTSRDRSTGGYGLGLAIAQTIVKAHGGKINVVSRVNEFAEFSLLLPKKLN